MTTLIKRIVVANAGGAVPGDPAIPPSPPYCIDVVSMQPSIEYIIIPNDHPPPANIIIPISGPLVSVVTHECFPGFPGQPAGPPINLPASQTNYLAGWNAGANSIGSLAGDGEYRFVVPTGAVGVITGLTTAPQDGAGYENISFAIYCSDGSFQIAENGVALTAPAPYSTGDIFSIVRLSSQVYYYLNNTLQFTSTQLAPLGPIQVDASLYFGGDTIVNAQIDAVAAARAAIGSHGALDPAIPGTDPGTLQYVSVHGVLGPFKGFAADNNHGYEVGVLGALTGVATSYNTGRVVGVLGINGTAQALVPQIFGSNGDGTNYAILAGLLDALVDPSGAVGSISGSAGANQFTPEFSVVSGYLQPLAGFALAQGSNLAQVAGFLGPFQGFSTNTTGAYVGSPMPPPENPTQLYADTFTGSGTLAVHNPDTGGPYGVAGSGSPADYTLNGSGGLPSAASGSGELTSATSDPGEQYTLSEIFTVTAAGAATLHEELGTAINGNDLVQIQLDWTGSVWILTGIVEAPDGTTLYIDSAFVTVATGVPHTIEIIQTPTGIQFLLDGTVVLSTTELPPVAANEVTLTNIKSGGTSNITIDSARLVAFAPVSPILAGGYLTGLTGVAFDSTAVLNYAIMNGATSGYGFFAQGTTLSDQDTFPGFRGTIHGPYPFTALGGAQARMELQSSYGLTASGTTTLLGEAYLVAPSPYLMFATGTGVQLGRAYLTLSTRYSVLGLGGAQAELSGGRPYALTAHGLAGVLGEAFLELSTPYVLNASGTQGNYGIVVGTLAGLLAGDSGRARLVGPAFRLLATGFNIDLTPVYEGYNIAFVPGQQGIEYVTGRYTDYPFERIIRFNDTYYGVGVDGLFELGGDTFAGDPIVAVVETAETDFGDRHLHRPISLYLSGRMGADMVVYVTSAEIDVESYTYTPALRTGARNQRARFGKGIKARYMAYGFTNEDGDDFELDELTPEVAILQRTA